MISYLLILTNTYCKGYLPHPTVLGLSAEAPHADLEKRQHGLRGLAEVPGDGGICGVGGVRQRDGGTED